MRKYLMLLFGIAGALVMSQFPAFHQQYLQRLGGTLDEVNRQVIALDERAAAQGMERYAYIRRFLNSSDASVRSEGLYLENVLARQIRIRQSIDRLRNAGTAMQLPIMIQYLDRETAEGVIEEFAPALTLNVTGLSYAGAGFGAGFLGSGLLLVLIPRRRRRKAATRPEKPKDPDEDEHPYRMS